MNSLKKLILIQLIMGLFIVNSLRIHSQSRTINITSNSSNASSANTKYYDNLDSPLANYYFGSITQ